MIFLYILFGIACFFVFVAFVTFFVLILDDTGSDGDNKSWNFVIVGGPICLVITVITGTVIGIMSTQT